MISTYYSHDAASPLRIREEGVWHLTAIVFLSMPHYSLHG